MHKVLRALACATVFAASTNMAHASYLIKSWLVTGTESPWFGGTEALFPDPTKGLDATATSGSVNFANLTAGGTLKSFLLSDPLTTINTCTTATVNGVTDSCATGVMSTGTASKETSSTYGQILDITGTQTFLGGFTYTITHDDGIIVKIDGKTVISDPGPTTSDVSSFTTTAGVHHIDILYGECCGNPAILRSNLPTNVPEPGSPELMALGLTGLLAGFRRKVWR
jgi:hypothetical protein